MIKFLSSVLFISKVTYFAHASISQSFLRGEQFIVTRSEKANVTDFNYDAKLKLNFTGQCRLYKRPCNICEGDCETDLDCAEGLACFIRDSKTPGEGLPVPGCSNNPRHLFAKDFCYNKTLSPCLDMINFTDNHGETKNCNWVAEEKNRTFRCEMYGHFCRDTCNYCRSGN